MPRNLTNIGILGVILGGVFAAPSARAEEAGTFGPGKIWCATQTTCHLRVSDREDYGFNALTLPAIMQQALLGPCQSRKDCVAEIVATPLPRVRLLADVRSLRWTKAPPEFAGRR